MKLHKIKKGKKALVRKFGSGKPFIPFTTKGSIIFAECASPLVNPENEFGYITQIPVNADGRTEMLDFVTDDFLVIVDDGYEVVIEQDLVDFYVNLTE